MSHGNTTLIQLVDNEAIYEIAGSRSGRSHRVWVDLRLCAAACGCRAYLTEGICGHADSALAAAKAAGLCGSSATAGRTSVAPIRCFRGPLSAVAMRSETSLIRARAFRALQRSQEASLRVVASVVSGAAIVTLLEPEVLYRERYIEAMQALLASGVGGNTLHVRAYSFDGPGSLPAGSNAAATWLTAFEAVWAESTSVEDAAERMPRGQRSKPTSSSSSQQKPADGS